MPLWELSGTWPGVQVYRSRDPGLGEVPRNVSIIISALISHLLTSLDRG